MLQALLLIRNALSGNEKMVSTFNHSHAEQLCFEERLNRFRDGGFVAIRCRPHGTNLFSSK